MSLTSGQRRQLRARAHSLQPVATIGERGLTDAVVREIELSIEHHELIKIRVPAGDRRQRQALFDAVCGRTGSELVQTIGRIAVLYRPASPPRIMLDG
jgi:RNA-binding protein